MAVSRYRITCPRGIRGWPAYKDRDRTRAIERWGIPRDVGAERERSLISRNTLELEHTTLSISRSTLSLQDPFYSFSSEYSFMTKYRKFLSICTTLDRSNIFFFFYEFNYLHQNQTGNWQGKNHSRILHKLLILKSIYVRFWCKLIYKIAGQEELSSKIEFETDKWSAWEKRCLVRQAPAGASVKSRSFFLSLCLGGSNKSLPKAWGGCACTWEGGRGKNCLWTRSLSLFGYCLLYRKEARIGERLISS